MKRERRLLAGNVLVLGLISCFADISSEMVYPLIPLYLTAAFGAGPALVGVIEGIAESLASLLKVFSGYISDRFQRKKALAFSGYATGLVYKLALIFAGSWAGILFARVVDRLGKGIRTAPRDLMIAESGGGRLGRAYGLHKTLDMAGSALGILLAYILLGRLGPNSYKAVFAWSIVPVLIALLLFTQVREKKTEAPPKREAFWKQIHSLDGNLKLYLVLSFIFTLGNSSNSFLILRASDLGFDSRSCVLLYLAYNLTASVLALPCGKLSDKIGRKALLCGGYISFALVYLGFAFCTSKAMMWPIFIVYGLYTAMTAGAERALIAQISPKELKGTMLGLQSTLVGLALLPASVIAGALWDAVAPWAPFAFGAAMALVAAPILMFKLKVPKQAA